MATVSRREVARWAASQLAGGVKSAKVASYLAAYLSDRKALREVELMIRDIEHALARDFSHATVHFTSAHELTAELKKQISKSLGIKNAAETTAVVDQEILGGVIVNTADKEYDGSLKTSIKQLKTLGN